MNHSKRASVLFHEGYNCAQATAAAFAADLGVEEAMVLRATAGFGGGIGGLRETCGAVSAMVYVAGMKAGEYSPKDLAAKKALYAQVRRMVREFSVQHGTIRCADLLKKASCIPHEEPSERTAEYYAVRPCAQFVTSAANIIARALQNAE